MLNRVNRIHQFIIGVFCVILVLLVVSSWGTQESWNFDLQDAKIRLSFLDTEGKTYWFHAEQERYSDDMNGAALEAKPLDVMQTLQCYLPEYALRSDDALKIQIQNVEPENGSFSLIWLEEITFYSFQTSEEATLSGQSLLDALSYSEGVEASLDDNGLVMLVVPKGYFDLSFQKAVLPERQTVSPVVFLVIQICLVVVLGVSTAASFIKPQRNMARCIVHWACLALFGLCASALIFFRAEFLFRTWGEMNEWIFQSWGIALGNILAYWLIFMLLASLFHPLAGALGLAVVGGVLPIASYFKELYRGSSVYPWDLGRIKEVKTISDGLVIVFNDPMMALILSIVIVAALSIYLYRPYSITGKKRRLAQRVAATAAVAGCSAFFFIGVNAQIPASSFDPISYYRSNGMWLQFLANFKSLQKPKMENYNKENVEQAFLAYQDTPEVKNDVQPNYIFIMSESFWDLEAASRIQLDRELLPTINHLRDTAISGNLRVSIFGGGTSTTEFEVLTGFQARPLIPLETSCYQKLVFKEFFSIASWLRDQGYDTQAMHPYDASNWDRNNAYPLMGFNEFLSKDDFEKDADVLYERGYISDETVTDKIIEEYEKHEKESDAPWFHFTVTVQNHPAYEAGRYDPSELVKCEAPQYSDQVVAGIEDLATGLHHADAALGRLIEYFEDVEEPVVIVFFGDHKSVPGDSIENFFEQSGLYDGLNEEQQQEMMYTTPFVAWSNTQKVHKNLGTIPSSSLLPRVLTEYGLAMPKWFEMINQMSLDGALKNTEEPTEKEERVNEAYLLLEYDYLYGKRYQKEIFN